jgi:hypothetical protein
VDVTREEKAAHVLGGGGRLRLVALATAIACLPLSAAAHAAVGVTPSAGGSTVSTSGTPADADVSTAEPLVSPQYQAKIADTAARVGATGPAADPSGGVVTDVAPRSRPASLQTQLTGPSRARPAAVDAAWYRTQNTRYQLLHDSFNHLRNAIAQSKNRIDPIRTSVSASLLRENSQQISRQIGRRDAQAPDARVISSGHARLLLRLGVGLGLAYVVFLAAWFWGTRKRAHSVTRIVRF